MAKAKEVLFWLGKGVKHINGQEYGAGEPLPVDEMNPESLKRHIKLGNIGGKIQVKDTDDGVNTNLTKELEDSQKANAELTKELEDSQKANAELTKELEDSQEVNAELTKELEDSQEVNAELTKELEAATAPKGGGK